MQPDSATEKESREQILSVEPEPRKAILRAIEIAPGGFEMDSLYSEYFLKIALRFEVPAGVGAVNVSRFSNAPAEKEIVLQRGLHYQITDVTRDPDGLWSGTARVLPGGRP